MPAALPSSWCPLSASVGGNDGSAPHAPGGPDMGGSLTFLHLAASVSELVEVPPGSVNRFHMCPSFGDSSSGLVASSLVGSSKRLLADATFKSIIKFLTLTVGETH